MSWEDDSITKYKCPCGLGEYTATLRSDDWNRSEERWSMDCVSCTENYQLDSHICSNHPPFDYSYRWVKKEGE